MYESAVAVTLRFIWSLIYFKVIRAVCIAKESHTPQNKTLVLGQWSNKLTDAKY